MSSKDIQPDHGGMDEAGTLTIQSRADVKDAALIGHGFLDPIVKGGLRGWVLTGRKFTLSDRWMMFGNIFYRQVSWAGWGKHRIKQPITGSRAPWGRLFLTDERSL
jgi:hypothetical protein